MLRVFRVDTSNACNLLFFLHDKDPILRWSHNHFRVMNISNLRTSQGFHNLEVLLSSKLIAFLMLPNKNDKPHNEESCLSH